MAAWVMTSERQPDRPGEYEICLDHGGPKRGYQWTGECWLTPAKVPTGKVYVWFDDNKKEGSR